MRVLWNLRTRLIIFLILLIKNTAIMSNVFVSFEEKLLNSLQRSEKCTDTICICYTVIFSWLVVASKSHFWEWPADTQKAHTYKRRWHSLIFWLNFANRLDQIPDRCLVFFCVIDCKNIFDCRFFLFTFIKSSISNKDWLSYFIALAQLIPFREVVTRKLTTTYWLKRKSIFLRWYESQYFWRSRLDNRLLKLIPCPEKFEL